MIRVDGEEKARGATRFTADMKIPGMLHGAIARAPVACGRIKRMTFSCDFDWNSVAIVTPEDIPGENIIHVIHDDMPCLARDQINYYGEPIALVAAETSKMAREAAKKISVEVEPEKPIVGIEELVNIFKISPEKLTIFKEYKIRKGDVERGFRESDNIVEGEYFTGLQEHIYLETQGMIAVPEENGKMRVLGSLQCPFYVRPAVARVLGKAEEDVIVEQIHMGGAFGGKEDFPSHLGAHAALLAFKTKRPVKIVLSRHEDIKFTTKRHPSYVRHRTGVKRDGTLTAMEIEVIFDAGAYQTLTPVVLSRGILHAAGAYRCQNIDIKAVALKSNMPPAGAFRGFGAPQVFFAVESHMDEIAAKIGISPLEIRRRNLLREGDSTSTGQILKESVGASECIEAIAKDCEYDKRLREIERFNSENSGRKKGLGIALFMHGAGFTGSGEKNIAPKAALKLLPDGTVEILAANTEMGQGAMTALSRIVADALSIPLSRVKYPLPETSRVPDSGPTVASRTTMIIGRTLELCAADLLKADHGKEAVFERQYDFPPDQIWDEKTFTGSAYAVFSWGAVAVQVGIDMATLEITPEEAWLVYEIGHAVNPIAARGQLEGGSVQALGYGLMEKMDIWNGAYLQDRLQTYIIPTASDAPEIHTRIIEIPYSRGPGGAKGMGELPMNGMAAAARNAVRHAIGVKVNSIPLTPEKLLESLLDRA